MCMTYIRTCQCLIPKLNPRTTFHEEEPLVSRLMVRGPSKRPYYSAGSVAAVHKKEEKDEPSVAQFFKQKSSRASRQVCWPGAEQADKFMF
jgi:hypothetical protein